MQDFSQFPSTFEVVRNVEKAAEEWAGAGIISPETAEAIVSFEKKRVLPGTSLALVIFAVLGSILIGLGISLMVAENWDDIPRNGRLLIAFLPMLAGQVLLSLAVFRFKESLAWREAASSFLVLSTGATLAILSQVFQMQGELSSFLLLWLICTTPVMFAGRSNSAFILWNLLCGWFAVLLFYQDTPPAHLLWMIPAVIGYTAWFLLRKTDTRAMAIAAGWFLPVLLALALNHSFDSDNSWGMLVYAALFQVYILFGISRIFDAPTDWKTGFSVIGFLGSMVMLFLCAQRFFIKEIRSGFEIENGAEWALSIVLLAAFSAYFYFCREGKFRNPVMLFLPAVLISTSLSFIDVDIAFIFMNIFILAVSVYIIRFGVNKQHLFGLNIGLLIFSILVMNRFFDYKMSFVARGLAFLIIGVTFFVANSLIIKKRKEAERE